MDDADQECEELIPKSVIVMQHGLADSSDSYIINDKDKAPA